MPVRVFYFSFFVQLVAVFHIVWCDVCINKGVSEGVYLFMILNDRVRYYNVHGIYVVAMGNALVEVKSIINVW
jgi:hypothetical protein